MLWQAILGIALIIYGLFRIFTKKYPLETLFGYTLYQTKDNRPIVRTPSKKEQKNSVVVVAKIPDPPAPQVDVPLDLKNAVQITTKDEQKPIRFRYIGTADIMECDFDLEICSSFSKDLTISKISWEIWVTGKHIKSGVHEKEFIAPKTGKAIWIHCREVLTEAEAEEVTWIAQKPKVTAYIEGILYVKTDLAVIQKKFTILDLFFVVSGHSLQKPQSFANEMDLDDIAGVFQKTFLDKNLQSILTQKVAAGPFALIFVDIDGLTSINEEHGNEIGNDAIRMVCGKIKSEVQNKGVLARYDEDSVVVLVENTPESDVQKICESIRSRVENHPLKTNTGLECRVTVTIGAAITYHNIEAKKILEEAEHSLFLAKKLGKNQVSVSRRKIPHTPPQTP